MRLHLGPEVRSVEVELLEGDLLGRQVFLGEAEGVVGQVEGGDHRFEFAAVVVSAF